MEIIAYEMRFQKDIIEHIIVKDGVENIGDEAFKDLDQVEDIIIAGSVEDLGKDIFDGCDDLIITSIKNIFS